MTATQYALQQAKHDIAAWIARAEMQDRIAAHKVQTRKRANLRLFASE